LVAGAILFGLVFSLPSASATPIGEAAGAAGSAVESVHATPNAAPLPSATPPTTRPAPVATPRPAPVPTRTVPKAPVKLPTEARPRPSPSPPSSRTDVPSVDRIDSAARNSVGSVTSTGKETTQRVATSARNVNGGRVSTSPNRPDAGASRATPRAIGTASSAPPSIRAAKVAALQRWFARIWPAISLGGGEAGPGWAAGVIGRALLRPAVAVAARLLYLAPPIARAAGDSPFAGDPGTANAPRLALPNASAPAGGEKIIYLVVLAGLLAFLAFTIWREFRSALRPGGDFKRV
jgi:hypothetical protein